MTTETTAAPTRGHETFADLRKVNVSEYIEKKNNLSYLSWAYAVDQLLQRDATATWEYRFGVHPETKESVPFVFIGNTAMVFCTVKAFGVERTAQLPVMDHRNKPIPNPDAFQVNTAMQRCLAKAIALHGLGLYIYAGEDLPEEDVKPEPPQPKLTVEQIKAAKEALANCETLEQLRDTYTAMDDVTKKVTKEFVQALKASFESK
jgi:hypothetical protein